MRIAITASKPDLDAEIDARFGRCRYFVVVDPKTMQFEAIENTGATGGGAGVATAQMIASKEISAVITGNCGPNAYDALSAAGIKVITGVTGKVEDAIESYKSGKLKASSSPNVEAHSGMNHG